MLFPYHFHKVVSFTYIFIMDVTLKFKYQLNESEKKDDLNREN